MALGLIKRTIVTRKPKRMKKLLATVLVQPKLEFESIATHPHYEMDKQGPEKVQRRATKLLNNLNCLQYDEYLKKLNLQNLTYSRNHRDVINDKEISGYGDRK